MTDALIITVVFCFWSISNASIIICPGLARQLNLASSSLINFSKIRKHLCHRLGKSNTIVSSTADK